MSTARNRHSSRWPNPSPTSCPLWDLRLPWRDEETPAPERVLGREGYFLLCASNYSDNTPYEKIGNNEPVSIADELPFEIPETWEWVRFGQVIVLLSGADFKPDEYNDQMKGIPYITGASSLSLDGVIVNRWTESPRVIANRGDVLLVCKGSGYGKTVICDIEEAHIARQIMAIKEQSMLDMQYVRLFLQANCDQIKSKGQGVIPGIDRDSVMNLLFPLPPLNEQHKIAKKIGEVEGLLASYDLMEHQLSSLQNSFPEQLRKSILQMAVQGKLVPQNPDDEPASVLLERIRAEKQRLVKEGKIKKDKHESIIFRRDNSHYRKFMEALICEYQKGIRVGTNLYYFL